MTDYDHPCRQRGPQNARPNCFLQSVRVLYQMANFFQILIIARVMVIAAIPFTWLPILWTWWVDRHREVRLSEI